MRFVKRAIALLLFLPVLFGLCGCTEYRSMDAFSYLEELERTEPNLLREPKLLQKDGDFYALYRLGENLPFLLVLQTDEQNIPRTVRFVFSKESGIAPDAALTLCGKGLAVLGRLPEEECVDIAKSMEQSAFFAFGREERQFEGYTLLRTSTPLFSVIEITDPFGEV